MLEQKFATGHESPEEILNHGPSLGSGCGGEHGLETFAFPGTGQTGKAAQVGFINDVVGVCFDKSIHATLIVAKILVERFAIG